MSEKHTCGGATPDERAGCVACEALPMPGPAPQPGTRVLVRGTFIKAAENNRERVIVAFDGDNDDETWIPLASLAGPSSSAAMLSEAVSATSSAVDALGGNATYEGGAARAALETLRGIKINPILEACSECGGSGIGPDRCDGPGEVYQDKCPRCDGKGHEPAPLEDEIGSLTSERSVSRPATATFEVDREAWAAAAGELRGTVTIDGLPAPERVHECAVCKLRELNGTVSLDELLVCAVAAGLAIAMVGGMTRHLCALHQRAVAHDMNEAIDASTGPL